EKENLGDVIVRKRAGVKRLGRPCINVAAKKAFVILHFRNGGAGPWVRVAEDRMRPGLAFEKISALSPGDFEDRVGEGEAVGTPARVSEMLPPRQSDRVRRNPAEVGLLSSRVAAPGRHHESDEQLVQHDCVLAKW